MENMITKTKAPLRISFAGGGTDVEPYISDYGSCVLSAAIKVYARASRVPNHVPRGPIEEMLSGMCRESIRVLVDAYPTSGLGGSTSCFVAGIKAMYPNLTADQIAKLAFYLERRVAGVLGGIQDQYCAAHGGFLFLVFEGNRAEVNRLDISEELSKYLLLVYTGRRKVDGIEIISDQLTRYNVKQLHRQKQISRDMRDCLHYANFDEFGRLLDEAWRVKKELSPLVSREEIDTLYSRCLSFGAIGGSLMGAGSGGYMLLMENPQLEGELRQNLINEEIPYQNVEFDVDGVRIVPRGGLE